MVHLHFENSVAKHAARIIVTRIEFQIQFRGLFRFVREAQERSLDKWLNISLRGEDDGDGSASKTETRP